MEVKREFIELFSELGGEVKIVSDEDVVVKGMSTDKTVALEVTFKGAGAGEGEYPIDINRLVKVLKRAKSKDKVELLFTENNINVVIHSKFGKRKFSLPIEAVDIQDFDIDALDYSNAVEVELDADDLKAIIESVGDIDTINGDSMSFSTTEDGLKVHSVSMSKEYYVIIPVSTEEGVTVSISADNMKILKKFLSKFDSGKLFLSDSMPLLIVGYAGEDVVGRLVIAPLADID